MRKNAYLSTIFLLMLLVFNSGPAFAQFLSLAEEEKREWRIDDEERAKRRAAKMKSRTEFTDDIKTRVEKFDAYGNKISSERYEKYDGTESTERITYKYNAQSSLEAEIRETVSKEANGRSFTYNDSVEYLYGADKTLAEVRKVSENKAPNGKSLYRYSTRYEYDADKNIISQTKYILDEASGQENIENRYTYTFDDSGYTASRTWTHKGAGGLTREVETFENIYYPAVIEAGAASDENGLKQKDGRKARLRSRVISRSGVRERAITVSEKGRYLEQVFYKPDGSLKRRTVFNYDSDENLVSEVEYDQNNRVDSRCVYKYDEKKRLIEETNFNAAGKVSARTVCSYDAEGNKTKTAVSYSSGGRETKKAVWRFNKFAYTIDFSRYDAFEKKKNITRFEYEYYE